MRIRTIRKLLDWLIAQFEKNEITSPKQNAEIIISHVLKMKKLDIFLHLEKEILDVQLNTILEITSRRKKHEPLQYILGETEFYGCTIKVTPDVLIPRPETELLVEKIIHEEKEVDNILEIGTGSGAIVIALAKNMNEIKIDAVDISGSALKIAQQNAELNNVEINFFQSDIFENVTDKYDLIISNPPYISQDQYKQLPKEIKDHEPKSALQAENNGLYFYKKILQKAKEHLTESGKVYFEIGYDQAEEISNIARENRYQKVEIFQDLNGFDRIMRIE
ncbi:MAG: peptide chain release factor N(5)-glutamine methyltransferase [Candidatus Cloacimonadota bacterium]|nr:peptide chain release factor N(5)-glutamine methyltransferase [Candidatus Cloacimonadota bacterium]